MEDMAQDARFRPEDHQVLLKHKDSLVTGKDERGRLWLRVVAVLRKG